MINRETITNSILADKSFTNLLDLYKLPYTKGYKGSIANEYNNGLGSTCYIVTIDDTLVSIIMPIFSTEKTITWNNLYINDIKKSLPAKFSDIDNEELESITLCPLYFVDKTTGSVSFMQVSRVSTWKSKGIPGKNGYSFYYWNDKLPNQFAVTGKHIKNYLNRYLINNLPTKDLRQFCYDFALANYKSFHNTDRSEKQLIKNIMEGLYAQVCVYRILKNDGYDVAMSVLDDSGDDFGIDIKIKLDNKYFNIDVKSTHSKDLRIKSKREATDVYAVTTWVDENVKFNGLIAKEEFWNEYNKPNEVNGMFTKPITSLAYINVVDIPETIERHNISKMKDKLKDNVFA